MVFSLNKYDEISLFIIIEIIMSKVNGEDLSMENIFRLEELIEKNPSIIIISNFDSIDTFCAVV